MYSSIGVACVGTYQAPEVSEALSRRRVPIDRVQIVSDLYVY